MAQWNFSMTTTFRNWIFPVSFFLFFTVVDNLVGAERPNIVLMMADDLGWGQAGYMNHPHLKGRTPNLDNMAGAGIRFNRFYAAAPVCSPTRASVLTGRSPARTGVPGLHKRLCLQEKSLAQALKSAGYATAHFGKWHLNGVQGNGVPILADDPNHPGQYGFDVWVSVTNFFDMNPLMSRNGTFEYLEGESSGLMVREALKFISDHRDRPTLTVVWYGSPHHPFVSHPEDREGFPDGQQGDQLGEIVAMDRSIGMLRDGLRKLGIEKETLVWFTSDNGGLATDPNSVGHLKAFKGSLNEGGIRVPALIEWSGRIQPAVTDFPASTMDIMPTIIDVLDLPDDSQLAVRDGESIASLFDGVVPQRTRPIPFSIKGTALIDGNFKLLRMSPARNKPWQLFDLDNDPGETRDISKLHSERFQALIAAAEAFLISVEASAAGQDYPERRVIQPQRGDMWSDMEEYKAHFNTFSKLKPDWRSPGRKSKPNRDEK